MVRCNGLVGDSQIPVSKPAYHSTTSPATVSTTVKSGLAYKSGRSTARNGPRAEKGKRGRSSFPGRTTGSIDAGIGYHVVKGATVACDSCTPNAPRQSRGLREGWVAVGFEPGSRDGRYFTRQPAQPAGARSHKALSSPVCSRTTGYPSTLAGIADFSFSVVRTT